MSRYLRGGAMLLATVLAGHHVAAQDQVFRAAVDSVVLDVDVRQHGRPVPGLTASDFEVRDNGVTQRIESSSLASVPIDVTLVVDTSGSVDGKRLEQLKGALRDSVRWLKPQDTWSVMTVGHVLREVVPEQPPGSTALLDTLEASGGTALYDGLAAALMKPAAANRRRLIIAYTDGDDTSSILEPSTLFDVAARFDSTIDVVTPGEASTGQSSSAPSGRELGDLVGRATATAARLAFGRDQNGQAPAMVEVTRRTGGYIVSLDHPEAISAAFHKLLDEYRMAYILWYARTGVPAEGWHELTVRLTRPDAGHFDVRARPGYWGGTSRP